MITPKVYRQAISGQCADYAMLIACQRLWIPITEEYMLSTEDLWIMNVFARLKADGYLTDIETIKTAQWVDFWLKKGHYIVSGTWKHSFDEVRNPPYMNSFKWNKAHNFCIIADLWDKWKCQDSQGEWFADKWCWYMLKSDFRKLKNFRLYP